VCGVRSCRMWITRTLFLPFMLLAVSGAAIAQAPPTPATPPQQTAPPATRDCVAAGPGGNPDNASPDGSTVGRAGDALGDKLARSNGVLCPPSGIDPEIRAPTPETGDKPVILPPGSPGGNPNVRPK
jgi:hypothetical protein